MATLGKIAIRIYRNYGQIKISPTADAYLKRPLCIRLLADPDFHRLIVQKCEADEPGSHMLVGKPLDERPNGISIASLTLVLKLYDANNLDKDAYYMIPGSIDAEKEDMILFDISKAERIEDKSAHQ